MAKKTVTIINIKRRNKNLFTKGAPRASGNGSAAVRKRYLSNESFVDSLLKYIGQTITIYTISGGSTGEGFTGILLDVTVDHIKILSRPAAPPSCPIDNCCSLEGEEMNEKDISLGVMTNILHDKIAAFVHNII